MDEINIEKSLAQNEKVYCKKKHEPPTHSLGAERTMLNCMMHNPNLKQNTIGISTGFTELDALTSGLHKGELIVVGSRPGVGKTAFAMNLVQNAATQSSRDFVTAIFSLEMPVDQLITRMIAVEGKVELSKLLNGHLNKEDWHKVADAIGVLSEASIYIDDTSTIMAMEIRSKCRQLKRDMGGLDLVMVDYLQLMNGYAGAEQREQEVSFIMASLKSLAREIDVPIIVLYQLNRSLESRADKRPILSDLRESSTIEKIADVIMFVYREEVYRSSPCHEGKADIIVAKQNNRPTGNAQLAFLHQFACFENLSQDEVSYDCPRT